MQSAVFAPLLLADLENVIGILFVVFWIVAWVLKLVASQAQKGPPATIRPKPSARPAEDRLQEEIDIFISEVSPKKPARRPPTAQPPVPVKPNRSRKPPLKQQTVEQSAAPAPAPRKKPGQTIAQRHIAGGEKLGEGVQQHLQQHMRERVAREAATFVGDAVDQSVSRHLGQATGPGLSISPPAPATAVAKPARLVDSLRNPTSLKQAMVVSLILGPPPGLQKLAGQRLPDGASER